jgi:hypothetical protein
VYFSLNNIFALKPYYMKTKKYLPFILLMTALALGSCKKSSQAPKLNNAITYTFQGTKYTVTNPLVTRQSASLAISGQVNGGAGAGILISNYQTATSETLYGQAYVNIDLTNTTADNYYFCSSGTLTVSSVSQTHISGTFNGTAMHTATSTGIPISGTFDVDIPQ